MRGTSPLRQQLIERLAALLHALEHRLLLVRRQIRRPAPAQAKAAWAWRAAAMAATAAAPARWKRAAAGSKAAAAAATLEAAKTV